MRQRIQWYLASFLLFTSTLLGAESWAQLKLGMTGDEATEVLGEPLFKTVGHGFELWIYDNKAEALFYGGPLVGWTTPEKRKSVVRSVDVWQRKAAGSDAPVFILPRVYRPAQRRDNNAESYQTPLYRLRN